MMERGDFVFLDNCDYYDPIQKISYTKEFGGDSEGVRAYRINADNEIEWLYSVTSALTFRDTEDSGLESYPEYYREDSDGGRTYLSDEEYNRWLEDYEKGREEYGIKERDSFVLNLRTLSELSDNEQVWRGDDGQKGESDWRKVYLDYLKREIEQGFSGESTFLYINEDKIPEIILQGSSEAGDRYFLTTDGSDISVKIWGHASYDYIPGENLVHMSGGNSDHYPECVITIEDGKWKVLFDVSLQGNPNEFYNDKGEMVAGV